MRRKSYERKKPVAPVQPVWRGDEPCRDAPEVFHPEQGDNRSAEVAKWLCRRCPSREQCLEWAVQDPQLEGIHAGTNARQRARMRANI